MWRTANENVPSSMAGIHFSHIKTAAWSDFLTNLYTAKLNACLEYGVPLKRWGKSLTVLLEKEFGSVFFDKLRAIILFEADFNWLQKIVFSRNMTNLAKKHNLVPPEQCAAPGKDCNAGTLLKVFHTDHLRTMHILHTTISADLENCYDLVAHAVAALGMRSFGVRVTTVAVFLS